jgi:Mg chelatase-like protein
MTATVGSVAYLGLEARSVEVQCHIQPGTPGFTVVGLPDKAVGESRERVRAAISAMGLSLPPKRITVNLSPADLPKEGSHFDLPIALAVLGAMGVVDAETLASYLFVGELGLDGRVLGSPGVLLAALHASANQLGLVCPANQGPEAAWAGQVEVIAAPDVLSLLNHFKGRSLLPPPVPGEAEAPGYGPDLAQVKGQETAKRAIEIAAAGGHNLVMVGPPGAGKSLMAACVPGILPELTAAEALQVSMVASVAGVLEGGRLVRKRPFRSPHHSASMAALVGGGLKVRPGEVSLAHLGVLFLDELPEFQRPVLDSLRQPLETGTVSIARANAHVTFPARVQLIAAMNPCDRIAFLLPAVPLSFRAAKPEMAEMQGNALGAHLRRRRRTLGLNRKVAAHSMGISEEALMKWETGACEPHVRLYPKVIAFLGYEPWPEPVTLGEKLCAERKRRGLSCKRAAEVLGIDEGTWTAWEHRTRAPTTFSLSVIDKFLFPREGFLSCSHSTVVARLEARRVL